MNTILPQSSVSKGCVLILHPTQQHSAQSAVALHEVGILQKFVTGSPVVPTDGRPPFWASKNISRRIRRVTLPGDKIVSIPGWHAGIKLLNNIPVAAWRHDATHAAFHAFDLASARFVRKYKPDVVVAYENSAVAAFKAAKQVGALCVLDAPSFDHRTASSLLPPIPSIYHNIVNLRKDKEVALADLVITCSEMARGNYINNGLSPLKVRSILLGCDLPNHDSYKKVKLKGEIATFLFAGTMSERKSIDQILLAFERMTDLPVKLFIAGGSEDYRWIEKVRCRRNIEYLGPVSQSRLFELMAAADCLLLPSRFDAFGMVVVEAMAVGTPAIVSHKTGAREIIESFPGSGWIIDPNAEALEAIVRKLCRSRADIESASKIAVAAAQAFTWAAYRRRFSNEILRLMAKDRRHV